VLQARLRTAPAAACSFIRAGGVGALLSHMASSHGQAETQLAAASLLTAVARKQPAAAAAAFRWRPLVCSAHPTCLNMRAAAWCARVRAFRRSMCGLVYVIYLWCSPVQQSKPCVVEGSILRVCQALATVALSHEQIWTGCCSRQRGM